jgi:K+-transporting ATPase ATPase B chain
MKQLWRQEFRLKPYEATKGTTTMATRSTQRTIVVNKGDVIPFDGQVIEGFALVDEAAISGVSTPAMIDSEQGRNQVIEGGVIVEGSLTIACNK